MSREPSRSTTARLPRRAIRVEDNSERELVRIMRPQFCEYTHKWSVSGCTCQQLQLQHMHVCTTCLHALVQAGRSHTFSGRLCAAQHSAVADSLWKYDHSASASFLSAFACTARLKLRAFFLQGCWRIDARSLGMYHCLRGPGCSGGYCPVDISA